MEHFQSHLFLLIALMMTALPLTFNVISLHQHVSAKRSRGLPLFHLQCKARATGAWACPSLPPLVGALMLRTVFSSVFGSPEPRCWFNIYVICIWSFLLIISQEPSLSMKLRLDYNLHVSVCFLPKCSWMGLALGCIRLNYHL